MPVRYVFTTGGTGLLLDITIAVVKGLDEKSRDLEYIRLKYGKKIPMPAERFTGRRCRKYAGFALPEREAVDEIFYRISAA